MSSRNIPTLFEVHNLFIKELGEVQAKWACGQAALESNWFTSRLAVEAKNLWGIKATPSWKGAVWSGRTHEFERGQRITITAGFRAYPTLQSGIHDYLSLTDRLYGSPLRQSSVTTFLNSLQGKWATDPHYSANVLQTIHAVAKIIDG